MYTGCFIIHNHLIPVDPSLTRENILEVVSNVPLWTSSDSSDHLEMPCRQHDAIVEDLKSEQAKDQIVSTWLSGHPCPSWEHIRNLLQWMERLGRTSKGEANKVEEKYIKSKCSAFVIMPKGNAWLDKDDNIAWKVNYFIGKSHSKGY